MIPAKTRHVNSFVSRANPRSNDKHVILGVIGWKPRDFANQMNLSLSNGWGIVRTIADMCLRGDTSSSEQQQQEAKFVLVKDPNKAILRLYQVPAGSFEDDYEEGEAEAAEEEAQE
jgi:translation initiation factor 3 subunit D